MPDYTQIPGDLDIVATHGDDFEFFLTFDIPLTGYAFTAYVLTNSSNTPVELTVTEIALPSGQISISLTKEDLLLVPNGKHRWYLDWLVGGKTRRALAGLFEVVDYNYANKC